jgi:hypothetical protein
VPIPVSVNSGSASAARRKFPDEGSRLVYRSDGGGVPIIGKAGGTVKVYTDAAGTILADVLFSNGNPATSFIVDKNSLLPDFFGPSDQTDTLYASVDNGVPFKIFSNYDERLDNIFIDTTAVVTTAVTAEATARTAADAAALTSANGTFAALDYRAVNTLGRFEPSDMYAANAPAPLALTTYVGGNNEVLEPSVIFIPNGWNGYRYWMVAGPYEGSNSAYENPSVWVSNDNATWIVPGTNPVVPAPGVGHNDDPQILLYRNTMHVVWNHADSGAGIGGDLIKYKTSTDGVTWSATITLLDDTAGSTFHRLLSPRLVFDGMLWHLWCLDLTTAPAPNTITHRTATSLAGPWSAPVTTDLVPLTGRRLWEFEVYLLGDQYVMTLNISDSGSANNGKLHFATSTNGVNWVVDYTQPVLEHGSNAAWDGTIYKACALPIVTERGLDWQIWYSAQGTFWKVGTCRASLGDPTRLSAQITAASLGVAPFLVGDTFNRSDNAISIGTPDQGPAWVSLSGTIGILSKRLYIPTATNCKSYLETGTANGRCGMQVTTQPTNSAWLMFRISDTNNYFRFGTSGAYFIFQSVISGATADLGPVGGAPKAGDWMEVRYVGNVIKLYVNGVLRATVTNAFNNTATKIGIQMVDTDARIDNVWCRSA